MPGTFVGSVVLEFSGIPSKEMPRSVGFKKPQEASVNLTSPTIRSVCLLGILFGGPYKPHDYRFTLSEEIPGEFPLCKPIT